MAGADRSTPVDIISQNAGRFDFYQLLNLLRIHTYTDDRQMAYNSESESVYLTSCASLSFSPRDVIALRQSEDQRWQLTTSFLGLHGSQSPLPGYYLDNLAQEAVQQETPLIDFLDLFNHRFLSLLHRIWRKYRYYICFEDEGRDAFSQRMYALVGLGSSQLVEKLQINHCKMLAYAGLLSSPGRSADVICGLIAHCFELDDVTLTSWELRYVEIAASEQNRLGEVEHITGRQLRKKSALGDSFTLGARVKDRSGKFTLNINGLSRSRFLDFLPNGQHYLPLTMFMAFILRDQFAWDLRLGIAAQQVSGMVLGTEHSTQLGWTGFLGEPDSEPEVTISVRA